jgi:hypothetical protein
MNKKHVAIVTFPTEKLDVYGFGLKGFIENWPTEVHCYAVVENPEGLPTDLEIPDNVTIVDFDKVCGEKQKAFEERNQSRDIMNMDTIGNVNVQAAKFAKKAYAQLWVLENVEADYVHYIDADLYTHKPFTLDIIEKLLKRNPLVAFTPRWWRKGMSMPDVVKTKSYGKKGHTETGYMIWNKNHEYFQEWINRYKSCYDNDVIFEFDGWHDCAAFDYATMTLMLEHNVEVADIGFGTRSNHPLVSGPLGKYLDHMKGNRKFVGFSKERKKVHG